MKKRNAQARKEAVLNIWNGPTGVAAKQKRGHQKRAVFTTARRKKIKINQVAIAGRVSLISPLPTQSFYGASLINVNK